MDDNRFLIEYSSPFNDEMPKERMENEVHLAMISTEYRYSTVCIKNVKPIWTHNNYLRGTIPLVGSNRVFVISEKEWTVHSIIDGAILPHINAKTLSLMLEPHSFLGMNVYTNRFSLFMGKFILYTFKHDKKIIAVD
ncbi:hypothetical protein BDF19DRAFT_411880 [Syncephalis fuscata]|nr:hypothetical protein BDF19DRAFT_411880 [Syncephalis fuscata]